MHTKENLRFLRDDVASIILTDESCMEYVERIVSSALNIDLNLIKNNLVLKSPRISANTHVKQSYVDSIYETDDIIINIEVNYSKGKSSNRKNMHYICHLVLKQTTPGMRQEQNLKPIYQININGYDYFKKGKFIYRSYIMEESIHEMRDDFITIIDINMDFLSKISYNRIKEEGEDSLERLLYVFVSNNYEIIDELYPNDEIMEKVKKKLSALTEDFAEGLYYDREEYINQVSFEMGKEEGIEQGETNKMIEIAKNLLKLKIKTEDIIQATGLTKEQLEEIANKNSIQQESE